MPAVSNVSDVSAVTDVPMRDNDMEIAPAPDAAPRRRLRLSPTVQREIILALFLILCYGFFRQVAVWNEPSRYDLAVALVDNHTTRIDAYQANTGDKAFYRSHYYSDKAPGSSLLVVPVYLVMRGAASLQGIHHLDFNQVIATFAFFACALPTVVLALLLLRFLRPHVGEWWALTMTAGYALGTIAFPFATMYFGHAATAFFLFAAFYLLWRARADGPAWQPILAGFLAGWAVLVDFSAAFGVGVLLLYALSRHWRMLPLLIAGAAPPAALLLGYNWVSFGGPFRLGYTNLSNSGFAGGMNQGILGVQLPKVATLNEILFGPRGLLHLSPWLALAPLGVWAARRPGYRREVAVCAAITLGYLLLNGGYYLPFGGWTPGPRFLTPMLPFAAVLVALAPRSFRPLVALQIAYSVALMFMATATMPNAPEVVNDPLGDLWLPRLRARDLADTTAWPRWGLHGAQPLILLACAAILTCLALYATMHRAAVTRRLAGVGAGVVAVFVLTLGTPLDLPPGTVFGAAPPARGVHIAIRDAGVTVVPGQNGVPTARPWAQIENDGTVLDDTKVVFSVYAPSGKQIWSTWYGHVRWRSHERERMGVEWSTAGMGPGDYRVGVAVTSAIAHATYASIADAGHVHIDP